MRDDERDTLRIRLDNNYPPVVKIDSVFGVKRVMGHLEQELIMGLGFILVVLLLEI